MFRESVLKCFQLYISCKYFSSILKQVNQRTGKMMGGERGRKQSPLFKNRWVFITVCTRFDTGISFCNDGDTLQC